MNQKTSIYISDICKIHRDTFPARPPNLARLQNEDEKYQLGAADGLFEFVYPPADGIIFGTPPSSGMDVPRSDKSKYLWVVGCTTLPGTLEFAATTMPLKRDRLTHTNLTGGADAHTAGELWFSNSKTVMINGGSSRYAPRNSKELQSVAEAFRTAGYTVANLGWDEETNVPLRMQTGKLTWL